MTPALELARGISTVALLALLVSDVPLAARVNDSTEGSEEDREPDRVFSEELSVTARAAASDAAAVTIIDAQEIASSAARNLTEALRGVAGVQVLTFGSRGGGSIARIRGGDENFTLVLLDGVPLNNATDRNGGSFNLNSLPLAQIERIEILRGPHSYFFGSSAMAGAVNIVTRQGGAETPRIAAGIEAGGASLVRADASVAGRRGNTDWLVGAGWEEEAERVAEERFEQLNLQANLGLGLGRRSLLRLTARFADWEAEDYPDASGGPVFGSGELRDSKHRESSLGVNLGIERDSGWRHGLSASLARNQVESDSPAIFPLVPPSQEDTTYTRSRAGWLSTWESPRRLRISGGVDVEREDARNRSVLVFPPFLGGAVSGDYSLTRTTPGAFAETVVDRGALAIEIGLRADRPDELGTQWSPRVGLRRRFAESGFLVRGSWSQAFKLPSFFALASPPALGGNPELRPEESTGIDLGLEYRSPAGDLEGGLTLFSNRYQNLIDFDFELFRHVNRARVDAEGVEGYMRWAPSEIWTVSGDATWQQVDDPDSAQPLLQLPRWIVRLRVLWRPVSPADLEVTARHVGSSFDIQIPVPDRTAVDPHTVVDLAFSWRLSGAWRLRARIDNLTDQNYQHFIGFPEPGFSARLGFGFAARSDPER